MSPSPSSQRLRRFALVALVVFLRMLFLNQPIQGDDYYYLAGAQHAQIDPLHPHHARYVFQGVPVDMRGHPHPPLNAWLLSGLLAIFGDIYEVRYHAAYIGLSILATVAMWQLAVRFSPRPVLATLLFIVTPAFIINGTSLEADLPFLAFWMAATAAFLKAVDAQSRRALIPAALLLALAALAAYQSIALVPILGVYLWLHARRWTTGWTTLLVIPAVLAAYQLGEKLSSDALPAAVLTGYFQQYGLQRLQAKAANALALTVHLGWMLPPLLAVASFRLMPRWTWAVIAALMLAALALDPHPLFWGPLAIGLLVLLWCVRALRQHIDKDQLFLTTWLLLFFAAALALFFAGAARYLLPVAAPLALLASRAITLPPRWAYGLTTLHGLLALALAATNYQHWRGYQRFTALLPAEAEQQRVWVNGEWGLRHYTEARGALPVVRNQAVQPGQRLVRSELAYPVPLQAGAGQRVPLLAYEIRPILPLRLIGLGARSAYSTASLHSLRAFDLSFAPVDRVEATVIVERQPTLSYLPMNAPEAERHLVEGLYQLEENAWRWTSGKASVVLRAPATPRPLQATLYLPPNAKARTARLLLDGRTVAELPLNGTGPHTITSEPLATATPTASVQLTLDQTFQVPGDDRQLGVILRGIGFTPP